MHGPITPPAPPTSVCLNCGGDGDVRVVDPTGAHDRCALCVIALVGSGDSRVTVFLDIPEQRR